MIPQILNDIAVHSGNQKLEILRSHSDNEVLRECFRLAYNPFIKFYIKQVPSRSEILPMQIYADLGKNVNLLKPIYNRVYTGNAALEFLQNLLDILHPEDAEVLTNIVKKDLRCGVNVSSINKVWPNLIPEYPVMLCDSYNEKTKKNIKFPAMVQLKMDGMRCNIHVTEGGVEVFSRVGKPLTTHGVFDELGEAVFKQLGHPVVLDGELVVTDEYGTVDRKTSNGIGNMQFEEQSV
jgi:hypothetical protein